MVWAAAAAVLLGALAQGVTGFGFGLVAGPLLIAFLGPQLGLRQSLLLAGILNAVMLLIELKHLKLRPILLMSAFSLAATPILVAWRDRLDVKLLAVLAGTATLAGVAMVWTGARGRWMGGPLGAATAGALGAAMNLAAGIAGPPAVLHAVSAQWPPASIRPSLQLYFLSLNIVGLSALGVPRLHVPLVTALAFGVGAGYLMAKVINEVTARYATLLLATAGALAVLARVFL